MYEISQDLSLDKKLEILSDAAKYDVACTSSGSDRRGQKGMLGNSCAAGICHSFAADGRCISLLKILMTNHCVYDCKYCKNRRSNDIERATFTPREICTLTTEFYKRNYIAGLFLSSGVIESPDYTMEKMCETLRLLRTEYRFNGYIHIKAIPGASSELINSAGLLADRISINMELPTEESLSLLAPNKSVKNIVTPMSSISTAIASHRLAIGKDARMERAVINDRLSHTIFSGNDRAKNIGTAGSKGIEEAVNSALLSNNVNKGGSFLPADPKDKSLRRPFAPAGQSTQMIIGASKESDYDIMSTAQLLYKGFDLKRVFYSAYIPLNDDSALPSLDTPVPLLREHRLYQADFLLRYYGFGISELLSDDKPNFDTRIDPKCEWALRHLGDFPVEVNKASYDQLIRVPGIGPTSIKRIMSARRYGHVNFMMLKKMGVVLKRAQFFITCDGHMMGNIPIEEQFILNRLTDADRKTSYQIQNPDNSVQMNLFNDFGLSAGTA
jgi:putative DNA modification/repair radical SAM protein